MYTTSNINPNAYIIKSIVSEQEKVTPFNIRLRLPNDKTQPQYVLRANLAPSMPQNRYVEFPLSVVANAPTMWKEVHCLEPQSSFNLPKRHPPASSVAVVQFFCRRFKREAITRRRVDNKNNRQTRKCSSQLHMATRNLRGTRSPHQRNWA